MLKTLFRKNYSRIIQTVTKTEKGFRRPEELLEAFGRKDDYKLVHMALVKRLLTSKSQKTKILTIRLWKWLLANGSFEFRNRLVQERTYITSTVRGMQDPVVESAYMEMIVDTAGLFRNEPGLQHMLEFTPRNASATQIESLAGYANADPNNPIFKSFASSTNDAVMGLQQVQKHAEITLTACDMFVEALNFNEGPIGDNELARILYQQLLTFKSANDRWIRKNTVGEEGLQMLLTCNDRILSAIFLLKQMANETEIDSFQNLGMFTPVDPGSNNNSSTSKVIYTSLDPSEGSHQPPAQEQYAPPTKLYSYETKPLPSTEATEQNYSNFGSSEELYQPPAQEQYAPPAEPYSYETKPLPSTAAIEQKYSNIDSSEEVYQPPVQEPPTTETFNHETKPLPPTSFHDEKRSQPADEYRPLALKNSREMPSIGLDNRMPFVPPREEDAIFGGNNDQYGLASDSSQDDEIVDAISQQLDKVEIVNEQPVVVSSDEPILAPVVQEAVIAQESPKSPMKAELQNSKRYFFNHPPKAWSDLQDIKSTMTSAYEELSKAAHQMESHYSDRTASGQIYIARGRQIHDLAQFAIDHWEPSVKDCRNPMVKKDLTWSFQQMEAMRGVLAVLLKRKFSEVKEGDDGHLLSSCTDLKVIFDSAINNLIAYELTKEQ